MNIVISIVIVSYKNYSDLIECLDSIINYNDIGDRLEIIVVDHSPDEKLFDIISYKYENISNFKIVRHQNLGFGSGNNYGESLSSGEYLFFLNPDTVIIEPIFRKILKYAEANNFGMLGFQLLNREGYLNKSFDWINHSSFFERFMMLKYYAPKGIFKYKKMYTEGADIFIKRETFEQAGKFDEKFFMYYEEPDLAKRLMSKGYVNRFYSDVKLIHKEGGSTYSSENSEREKLKSLKYYCYKYGEDFEKIISKEIKMTRHRLLFITGKEQRNYWNSYMNLLFEIKQNHK